MFNPIQPKGVRTTLLLAAFHLRDRRFQLVEGWLTFAEIGLRDGTFPNVTLQPRTADVGSIYARTDCLLVPSVWQEPFGRVVLEALQNGLPVAASAVGGIPEVMAGSPLLIQAYEDPEAWARALRSLDDPSAVAELRAWSLERASSFDHEREMDRLAELLRLATAARAPE
jgi:glycosyltransferase involved in cell wall biosynthesis